jgi:hypothetical protein
MVKGKEGNSCEYSKIRTKGTRKRSNKIIKSRKRERCKEGKEILALERKE